MWGKGDRKDIENLRVGEGSFVDREYIGTTYPTTGGEPSEISVYALNLCS